MKSFIFPVALALALPLAAFAAPVAAQEETAGSEEARQIQTILKDRAKDAVSVLNGEKAAEDVFAPVFLSAVSAEQLAAIQVQLTSQFGALQGVESVTQKGSDRGELVLRFEKALGTGGMAVETKAPHRITELLLQSFAAKDDSLDKIQAELEALPGNVGVLFTRLDGTSAPILSINPDTQYAIGSTFKLYILSALARSVENGDRNWSDVVELDRRSFPSGKLQDWPKGAPITLQTLATLMISISDNTATDILLYELGRDEVEAELLESGHSDPDRTLPFLSTLQMFALKGSPGNLRKYIAADEATQRFILADFEDDVGGDRDLVTPPRFVDPLAIDTVEWFASGNDLQKLVGRLAALSDPTARNIMTVNTSLPKAEERKWAYVGYKGGSEPGVLNLTWLLRDEDANWHMLSMSWNNTEANLDNSTLELLAQRILGLAE